MAWLYAPDMYDKINQSKSISFFLLLPIIVIVAIALHMCMGSVLNELKYDGLVWNADDIPTSIRDKLDIPEGNISYLILSKIFVRFIYGLLLRG